MPRASWRLVAGFVLLLVLHALSSSAGPRGGVFVPADAAGISFHHENGARGEKYYVETMGSGACWLDYDDDGSIDLYVVNSAWLAGQSGPEADAPRNRLYRNSGAGRFIDVTDKAGVGDSGYGMGCTAGDIDNDGFSDLYVTNFGSNVLYRNKGDGTFSDITTAAGVDISRWSASAAFADIDNDGDLDLYVTNYLDFTLANNKPCGNPAIGYRAYCHPDMYAGEPDSLYRNEGDGRFTDISRQAGVADPGGKGLGVVFVDVDQDGWQDIYVANDKTINFLYLNQHDGTFRNIAILSGTGFSESGSVQAGMGTDAADVDGNGWPDLVVTNLDHETNELLLNNGDLTFTNATFGAGMGSPNFLNVGFGADFLDFDNDADKDLLIVNGHIIDNVDQVQDVVTYEQSRSLMLNDGRGRFVEAGAELGPAFFEPTVGRGLAVGDMDNDGDLDFFAVNNARSAELFRNETVNGKTGADGHWLLIGLTGTRSNRDGVGARVRVMTTDASGGARWQVEEVRTGSSYLSQNDMRLHFGLGRASRADIVEIHWPSGTVQTLRDVNADQILPIVEQ